MTKRLLVCCALVVASMPNSAESFQFGLTLASTPKFSTSLSAHSLTTALECLWEDRVEEIGPDEKRDYESLIWLDLESDMLNQDDDKEENTLMTLPLYPLTEVYLPMSTTGISHDTTIVNHTLNNVEPQNVKMALDLLSEAPENRRFCVVLRAMDTGRIASIGTILRIVDADIQKNFGDEIMRIRLTCQSEGLAEITEVENGNGWREKRLLRSEEYLRARLSPLDTTESDKNDWQDSYRAITKDLRTIKVIYQLQLGSEDYPPDTLLRLGNEIRDFPELPAGSGDALLWELAQEWQSVCMTLRQGRQALLATERNEKMVEAACAYGGPLKLPIHMEDLDPKSRLLVQELDQDFQYEHEESGMDPILDFQVLIGLGTTNRRFGLLQKLVARERLRLESIASSSSRLGS